ncbi:putative ribonuclease H-like domain-containing protein [Tanacetum coccineum]
MVELRADVEFKDTLLVDVPKFVGETYTMSTIRVEYERTPPRCSSCKVFGHVLDNYLKKIVSDVLKNLKSPRQFVSGFSGKKKQAGLTRENTKKVDDPVNADSDSEVDEVYNKTAGYMASTSSKVNKSGSGLGNKSRYEQWKDTYNEDPCDDDDFDNYGLTDTQMKDLQLEDAEGVECLPNSTIFEQLALMGPKTTAWNEFSSIMASAIICLATNQKFNFSKFIFEIMIRNELDNGGSKFNVSKNKTKKTIPTCTLEDRWNMRRVGKGFSRRETPLFPTMVVQAQAEMVEDKVVNEEMDDNLVVALGAKKPWGILLLKLDGTLSWSNIDNEVLEVIHKGNSKKPILPKCTDEDAITKFMRHPKDISSSRQSDNSGISITSQSSSSKHEAKPHSSRKLNVQLPQYWQFARRASLESFKRSNSAGAQERVNVNTARVNRPVLSNQTSQVNLKSPKKCFSKQSSPVNRPFSRNTAHKSNKYAVKGKMGTAVKTSAGCVWRKVIPLSNTNSGPTPDSNVNDHPLKHMEHRGIFDSGCSGHMTGNRAHLEDYQELSKVGSVTFGGSKGSISGKGTIRLGNLVFDDVAFVKELGHFNLFSISQICDKKLNVLFTEKECYVVSSDFKMPDANQVLLKVPRQHNMYTFDMKNVASSKGYTCLLAKASSDEAKLWHRRLGHLNFKNLNKLVKDNLVRGLPSKSFKNDHTCVACQKGKQHKASCKAKIDRYVTHPLHTLHMDLFGPTSVRSINHASYCLVITDDCSRFCWVFFLAKKDETSDILKTFIRQIENQLNQKVKIIRSDNGTEFKNRVMLEFCGEKGIKQEFSNARTPQQNGVAERMNRTLIEAARTMLADSHLPTTFWAEAVNTACYTFNRVRVTKPQNKTPYELLFGHKPILSYIRPFGCHVTILNTLSPLGKFDGKSDEGFLVGYSVNSKAFRVYNLVTKRVEVNLHVNFLEEKPNVQGIGHSQGSKEVIDIDVQTEEDADLMVVSSTSLSDKIATKKTHSPRQPSSTPISKSADDIMTFRKELDALALKHLGPVPTTVPTSTNPVNTGSSNLNTAFEEVNTGNTEAISPSAIIKRVFSEQIKMNA